MIIIQIISNADTTFCSVLVDHIKSVDTRVCQLSECTAINEIPLGQVPSFVRLKVEYYHHGKCQEQVSPPLISYAMADELGADMRRP